MQVSSTVQIHTCTHTHTHVAFECCNVAGKKNTFFPFFSPIQGIIPPIKNVQKKRENRSKRATHTPHIYTYIYIYIYIYVYTRIHTHKQSVRQRQPTPRRIVFSSSVQTVAQCAAHALLCLGAGRVVPGRAAAALTLWRTAADARRVEGLRATSRSC